MSKHSKKGREKGKGVSTGEKIAGIVILILAVWGAYSFSQPPQPTPTTTIPTTSHNVATAPDFTLPVVSGKGLTGQKVSLSSFRGRVVFLEFMEPWCPHCQSAVPALERLYEQFGPQNVVFLVISGPSEATADDTAKFIVNYHSSLIYVYDSSGTTFAAYGVQTFPVFLLIDKNGVVATSYTLSQGDVLPVQTIAADITRLNS